MLVFQRMSFYQYILYRMNKDQLWNILYRVGIVTQQDPNAYLEIFRQYARMRHGQQIVDIREVLIGFINTVTEKV